MRKKGLELILSITKTGIDFIFSNSNRAINSSVISSPASAKISPVSILTMSSDINLPINSSFEISNSLRFFSSSCFNNLGVNFLPCSITTFPFDTSGNKDFPPIRFSGTKSFFHPSLNFVYSSLL